jgi:hypothetical protein
MFLDIIHRPVFISKHNVSETAFCLLLQVKLIQLGAIDRVQETGTSYIVWAQLSRFYIKKQDDG